MTEVQWIPPEPRHGASGAWDRFVGPGATAHEEMVQLVGGLALSAFIGAHLYVQRESLGWSALQVIVAALLVFDITGGIITNATSAAKRWYHRPGHDGLRAHLPFIAAHGVHLLLIAALFRGMDWAFFAVLYGYLLASAVLILRMPLYLQRPVGYTLFCFGILIALYIFAPTAGLEWFVPFFYFKLLVSHLLKEAPFTPESR